MASVSVFCRHNSWKASLKVDGMPKEQVTLRIYGGEERRLEATARGEAILKEKQDAYALDQQRRAACVLLGVSPDAPTASSTMTVKEWWKEYDAVYGPYKKDGGLKAASTLKIDADARAAWEPLIGHLRLTGPVNDPTVLSEHELTKAQTIRRESYCLSRPGKLAESTVKREVSVVNVMLNRAVQQGRLPKNPFQFAQKLKVKSNAHRILEPADQVKLFALPLRHFPVYVQTFVQFLLLTGLRIDEVLNEHFTDHGTYARVRGKGSVEREVAIIPEARAVLDRQWADPGYGKGRYSRAGSKYPTRPWWQSDGAFRTILTRACKRVGITHLSPHDLRHTFGHRWLLRKGDIKLLSLVLGHKNVATTEKHYAYLKVSDVREAMRDAMLAMTVVAPAAPPSGTVSEAPQTPQGPPPAPAVAPDLVVH